MRRVEILTLALLAMVVLLSACDGDDGGPGGDVSPEPIEGDLPPNFPDDFPLYPDLNILESSPLGEHYIVRADSGDPAEAIIDFYEEELAKEPWELVEGGEASGPDSTLLRFTAPGWPVDGRVMVAEVGGGSERTIVGIAVPVDFGEGG